MSGPDRQKPDKCRMDEIADEMWRLREECVNLRPGDEGRAEIAERLEDLWEDLSRMKRSARNWER
jgi:hypothetical protein